MQPFSRHSRISASAGKGVRARIFWPVWFLKIFSFFRRSNA